MFDFECPVCGDVVTVNSSDGNCSMEVNGSIAIATWDKVACPCCGSVLSPTATFIHDHATEVEVIENNSNEYWED